LDTTDGSIMKIFAVGLNHKSAGVETRERLAFGDSDNRLALGMLKERYPGSEFVLLSTCNRVELYCATGEGGGITAADLAAFLSEFHGLGTAVFKDLLYVFEDAAAARHLLTVASSLDSMVVGEAQIMGQVKSSYRMACEAKTTGKILNRLFHCAFATSKKVRATTSISQGRVSVAGVAVELAGQLFGDIPSARVVVIGAGQMGELIVRHLLDEGCGGITVVNRSGDRAAETAARYGLESRPWAALEDQMAEADMVIAAAGGGRHLVTRRMVAGITGRRRGRPLLVIDIAVPRNCEPGLHEIDDVYLYTIDDLSRAAEQNRKVRETEIARGMQIVDDSAAGFVDWFKARDIGPLIGRMKRRFEQISRNELERFFVGTRHDADCRDVLEAAVTRIVRKLLHCVIAHANDVTKEHGAAEAARLVENMVRQAETISSADRDNGVKPNS
jgi:glutamyl-tRNA reductase